MESYLWKESNKMFRNFFLVIALIFVVYLVTGCQTVQGLGEDITSIGEAGEAALEWEAEF